MPSVAPHALRIPASAIRRIYDLAQGIDDVVFLNVGEPDLPVAPHVLAAGARAWEQDVTNYTPNGGIAPLRTAIAAKLRRDNGLDVTPDQVWVTAGGMQALHQAMSLTLDAGDEVLVPDPGYVNFAMTARHVGAVPVPYRLDPARGFRPDLASLRAAITPRTRVLLVNSPSNPLGTVYEAEVLRQLLDVAAEHDLWVISDEVYEQFTYGTPHVSTASLDTDGRVLSVFSFSKTYALTGARVGWLVAPPQWDALLRTAQEATVSCVNAPAQFAALAALEETSRSSPTPASTTAGTSRPRATCSRARGSGSSVRRGRSTSGSRSRTPAAATSRPGASGSWWSTRWLSHPGRRSVPRVRGGSGCRWPGPATTS